MFVNIESNCLLEIIIDWVFDSNATPSPNQLIFGKLIHSILINQFVIGIDLGTNTYVWLFVETVVQLIPNDQGNRTSPAYAAFTDSERLIRGVNIDQSTQNPKTPFTVQKD